MMFPEEKRFIVLSSQGIHSDGDGFPSNGLAPNHVLYLRPERKARSSIIFLMEGSKGEKLRAAVPGEGWLEKGIWLRCS